MTAPQDMAKLVPKGMVGMIQNSAINTKHINYGPHRKDF